MSEGGPRLVPWQIRTRWGTSRPATSSSTSFAVWRPHGSTLEESLALWERGEQLAKVCRDWLEGARARLDAALAQESGGAGEGPEAAAEE